jgi:hypothetical protein
LNAEAQAVGAQSFEGAQFFKISIIRVAFEGDLGIR